MHIGGSTIGLRQFANKDTVPFHNAVRESLEALQPSCPGPIPDILWKMPAVGWNPGP